MKKILLFALLSISATAFAQNSKKALIVANGVIVDAKSFKPADIASKKIYTTKASLPQELSAFADSFTEGTSITALKIKSYDSFPDRISLADLNEQFGLPVSTPVMVFGYKINDTSVLISGELFEFAKVKDNNGEKRLTFEKK